MFETHTGKRFQTVTQWSPKECSHVKISAERLARKRGGGSNTMDLDSGQITIALAHFASLGVAVPRRGNRLKGHSPA